MARSCRTTMPSACSGPRLPAGWGSSRGTRPGGASARGGGAMAAPWGLRPRCGRSSTAGPRLCWRCWDSRRAGLARRAAGSCCSGMRSRRPSRSRCLSERGAFRSTASGAPSRARAPASSADGCCASTAGRFASATAAASSRAGTSSSISSRLPITRPRWPSSGARCAPRRCSPSPRPLSTIRRSTAWRCRRRSGTACAMRSSSCFGACWLPPREGPHPGSTAPASPRHSTRPSPSSIACCSCCSPSRARWCRPGIRCIAAATRSKGCERRPKRRVPSAASGRRSRPCPASRTRVATPARSSSHPSTAGSSRRRARRWPRPCASTTASWRTRSFRSRHCRPPGGAIACRLATSASNNWAPSTRVSSTISLNWTVSEPAQSGLLRPRERVLKPRVWPPASRSSAGATSGSRAERSTRRARSPGIWSGTPCSRWSSTPRRTASCASGCWTRPWAAAPCSSRHAVISRPRTKRRSCGSEGALRRTSARPIAQVFVASWPSTASTASISTRWRSRWPACRCGSRPLPAAARCRFSTIASSRATAWWAPRSRTCRASRRAGVLPDARARCCPSSRVTMRLRR